MRLFIAAPVPASDAYARALEELRRRGLDFRPAPGHPHVTLRFLGEVHDPAPVAAALRAAVQGRPPLPAVVEGFGAFPNPRAARIVWAAVRAPGVEGLAQAVARATAAFGQPPDARPFVAHVTLARLARTADVRGLLRDHARFAFGEGVLDRVVLCKSTLGPGGAVYEALAEAPLAVPAAGGHA